MKKLLAVVGPTATGKTELGIFIANKFSGEIVSADSRQIYRGMDIGTGKVDVESKPSDARKERGKWIVKEVPIHLYDVIDPDRTFSVAEYQQLAYKTIDQIHQKGKLPILVGGTGLYVQSVTEGLKIPKAPPDKNIRSHLQAQPTKKLMEKLKKIDPQTSETIDPNNQRRIIRALEVFFISGTPLSKLKSKYKAEYDVLKIGLSTNRTTLYARADKRIEKWFKHGFIAEVEDLLEKGYAGTTALNSLGYRQVAMYLHSKISLEEAKKRTKFEHHNYMRRQITWFKRDKEIYWFDIDKDFESQVNKLIESWLKSK